MLFERNPETGERFENIIKLRNAKNKAFEKLKKEVEFVEYVRYEDLMKNPLDFISKIEKKYNLFTTKKFNSIDTYKGITRKTFVPKTYAPISKNDLQFIKKNLDSPIEKKIGYDVKKYKPANNRPIWEFN